LLVDGNPIANTAVKLCIDNRKLAKAMLVSDENRISIYVEMSLSRCDCDDARPGRMRGLNRKLVYSPDGKCDQTHGQGSSRHQQASHANILLASTASLTSSLPAQLGTTWAAERPPQAI
jgi:hypothetical protein